MLTDLVQLVQNTVAKRVCSTTHWQVVFKSRDDVMVST